MAITQRQRRDVLEKRGIEPWVADYVDETGRPRYASYETFDDIRRFHTHPAKRYEPLAALSPGLVINRWGLASDPLPSYLRTDVKLWTPDAKERPYMKAAEHPIGPGFTHSHPRGNRKEKHAHKGRPYRYPSRKDLNGASSKMIDVHPLSLQLLHENPDAPIYFCLEGCLKADALLSHGQVSISVPSVTLWELSDADLKPWLPILKRAPEVFVIPDSDYLRTCWTPDGEPVYGNKVVRKLTDDATKWLHDHGVRRITKLIPPYVSPEEAVALGQDAGDWIKQGVDDHLARGGNLLAWHETDNPLGMHNVSWAPRAARLEKLHGRDRSVERDTKLYQYLTEINTESGFVQVGYAASALGYDEDTIANGLASLQDNRRLLRYWRAPRFRDVVTGKYTTGARHYRFVIDSKQQTEPEPLAPKRRRRPQPTRCPQCGSRPTGKGRPHEPGSVRCRRRTTERASLVD